MRKHKILEFDLPSTVQAVPTLLTYFTPSTAINQAFIIQGNKFD